ncbi:hypothetical protein C1I38_03760 [Dehalobacter sp. 12DCB1]|nr:hypothetical protein C1I38_03760 [Dehalobacter sp. 12DCB1]
MLLGCPYKNNLLSIALRNFKGCPAFAAAAATPVFRKSQQLAENSCFGPFYYLRTLIFLL